MRRALGEVQVYRAEPYDTGSKRVLLERLTIDYRIAMQPRRVAWHGAALVAIVRPGSRCTSFLFYPILQVCPQRETGLFQFEVTRSIDVFG